MEAGFPQGHSRCLHTAGPSSPPACVIHLHRPKTLLSTPQLAHVTLSPRSSGPGRLGTCPRPPPFAHVPHARRVTLAPPTPPAPSPRGPSVTLSASAAATAEGCCASAEQAAMGSLRGLRLAAGETRGCGRQEGASPVGVYYFLHPWEDSSG